MKDKTAIALIKDMQEFERFTNRIFAVGVDIGYFSNTIKILAKEYGIPKGGVSEFEDMIGSLDEEVNNAKRIVKHMKCEGMKYR